jgi:hypothetical protein
MKIKRAALIAREVKSRISATVFVMNPPFAAAALNDGILFPIRSPGTMGAGTSEEKDQGRFGDNPGSVEVRTVGENR